MQTQRIEAILLLATAIAVAAFLLTSYGGYGVTLFAILPTFTGVLGAAVNKSSTPSRAMAAGIVACLLASLLLLLLGREGLICIVMMLPLSALFGALGGLLYLWISSPKRARAALMLIPIPLATSLGFDATARSPVYEVSTAIEINAPPERVWQNVVAFSDLAEPQEWYFHTGLAYPTRTRIVGSGLGAIRYCDLSTGPVVETVTQWEPARLLEFDVVQTPAPMEEWSPYGHIAPKHLHGYFVSKHGRFQLIPLARGRTRLEGTSSYQHGLYPAIYWRLWSDATVHRIHERVLTHIRKLSEN
jgi:hypothetical protein